MRLGLPAGALRAQTRLTARWLVPPGAPWSTVRKRFSLVLEPLPPPRGTEVSSPSIGGVPCDDLRPHGSDPGRVVLFLHGGGYTIGTSRSHRQLAGKVGDAAGARVVLVDYRMGPEHRHPAGLEDALAVFRGLVAEGIEPARIAVAGDSAGGGLSLALALKLRELGEPGPGVIGLICPWLDLTESAHARRGPAPGEPLLSERLLRAFAEAYLPAGDDGSDPLVSPLLADLTDLPPIVVQSGADDLVADDARVVEQRAREAGVDVEHRVYTGLWHDFHLFASFLAGEGGRAPAEFGSALGRRLG